MLVGGNDSDTLQGGLGADSPSGGAGADAFRFASAALGADTITDYVAVDDRIEVVAGGFGLTVGNPVPFSLDAAVGTGAQFVFRTATSELAWDTNGTNAGGETVIAKLIGVATLDASEIVVIA